MSNKFEYDEIIHEIPENGGAYVIFPWDIREVFGKGRVKVHAEFDGIPYNGSIVNMGIKDSQGNVCYIIGVLKSIREKLKKRDGNSVHIVIEELTQKGHVSTSDSMCAEAILPAGFVLPRQEGETDDEQMSPVFD